MKNKKIPYHSNSGFKTPTDYFDKLEENLVDTLFTSTKNESLQKIPKESGFKVPKSYFDELETKLLAENITKKSSKVIRPNFNRKKWYAAMAVAAIALIIITINPFKKQDPTSWDDVELSAMEQYIEKGFIDLSKTDFSTLSKDAYLVEESSFNNMNPDAVVDYLDQNVEYATYILE
ncbi:hypothetical protein [Zunongwangia sp.]|uniref:hypothetical protein n=1 Tax=Zunongwangia sp. TaxID=1965325 RepID=UPI003AA8729F